MCNVLLPPSGNPIAVNKYIISYHILLPLMLSVLGLLLCNENIRVCNLGEAEPKFKKCILGNSLCRRKLLTIQGTSYSWVE